MEHKSIDIQRLTKPRLRDGKPVANPFSFGGGYANGGLSDEAMEVLGPLCQFDYMGASEFEHGALPLALQAMAQNKKLTTFSTEVRVPKNKNAFKHEAEGPCVDTVYVLCPEDWRDEVTERIEGFAKKEDMRKTRCAVQLERSIRIRAKGTTEPGALGWIEINNGYAFFIDEAMWKGFCEIFEVAIPG